VHGSGALFRWLFGNELVDEMNLFTSPVVVGQGTRLFAASGPDPGLTLVESRATMSGVTIQLYRPNGRPHYPRHNRANDSRAVAVVLRVVRSCHGGIPYTNVSAGVQRHDMQSRHSGIVKPKVRKSTVSWFGPPLTPHHAIGHATRQHLTRTSRRLRSRERARRGRLQPCDATS
jgi:RibD C-terminal domain